MRLPCCPYKGLEYFDCNDEDVKYFYGRTSLTDSILEKIRQSDFLAILGASGSGKSSVVRAGMLYQLKCGRRLSGSSRWPNYIMTPGEHPLHSLAMAFLDESLSAIDRAEQLHKLQLLIDSGSAGFYQLISAFKEERIILVIDQFEECFTLCRDSVERQLFFECILGTIERTKNKFCLVLVMRADFFNKCLEKPYNGLAKKIEGNLVTVTPMTKKELEQAIVEPAKQVGLEVEGELANQILIDVEDSPGSLPLLQYTLTELWKRRSADWLTFSAYNHLGGIRGTLQKRADEVYHALNPEEKLIAKHILLELTQLGEGTEDTRRRVEKSKLINTYLSEQNFDQVIHKLASERLIVTAELLEKSEKSNRIEVIDIAHEALIRHWPRLQGWINENRNNLRIKRNIEEAAEDWYKHDKSKDYLLKGLRLIEAEKLLEYRNNNLPFSIVSKEFLKASWKLKRREKRGKLLIVVSIITSICLIPLSLWYQEAKNKRIIENVAINSNLTLPELLEELPDFLDAANMRVKAGEVNLGKAYYQKIITETVKFERAINDDSNEFHPKDKQIIQSLRLEAEEALVKIVSDNEIPILEIYLAQGQIGKLKPETSMLDFENQYTDGARKVTYEILMRPTGVGADANADGEINNLEEAQRMPCKILEEIEKLWRQYTNSHCGFYGEDFYVDGDCKDLGGRTLTESVFFGGFDSIETQLISCDLAPDL
ncbi:MAG: hypothetical protein ACFE0I_21515 [Elainellaceae cyanobacterium]